MTSDNQRLFMLLMMLTFSCELFARASESAIRVCPTCSFTTIKEAIHAAKPRAVVTVEQGLYKEGQIVIDKPLTLKGEGFPVLDGEGKYQIVTVLKANEFNISGFVLQNTGMSYTQELAGVRIIESEKCDISNNRFKGTTYGVYLENSKFCHISGNEFDGQAKDDTSGGNGVHVWYGSDHLVEKNKITGHRDGVYLEFSTRTQIRDNDVRRNLRYGLHFMSSSQTEYHRNHFSENGAGVAVMYSRDIRMYDNYFVENTGPAAYALLLKEVHNSEIFHNEFTKNTVALFLEGSNRSKFQNNLISSNGWGLRILGDCENNEFTNNNFVSNTFDVTTNADHSSNTFQENYWSQYDGYDLNRNGIGDKPYRPVSLSSVILERVDSSYILMNSFFFKLMDETERALPSLIPEPLKDESPMMKPISGGGVRK